MTDINEDLVHKLFDKKSPISGGAIKSKTMSNQALEEQLHKPIIRKFIHPLQKTFWVMVY